jgi:hypothetical protein
MKDKEVKLEEIEVLITEKNVCRSAVLRPTGI